MVKFNIIDLIWGLSLESLIDKVVFSICYPQLLVVKDTSKSSVGHKSTLWFILVLEEWLDQKSSVFHVSANSTEDVLKFLFFSGWKLVSWVENGWYLEGGESLGWVLLQILFSEDTFDSLVEVVISDFLCIIRASIEVFKFLIFFNGQLKLLCIKSSSKLSAVNNSLSKWIMILEEFTKSDSMSLNEFLDLLHEGIDVRSSCEIS